VSSDTRYQAPRIAPRWALAILVVATASIACEKDDSNKDDSTHKAASAASQNPEDFDDDEVGTYDGEIQEQLEALGYAELAPAEDGPLVTGVRYLDEERAQPGLNMYCSPGTGLIHFFTNSGEVMHTISFPSTAKIDRDCTTIAPTPDGDLVVLTWLNAILKFGLDGTLRWSNSAKYHHDLDILADGSVYTLGIDPDTPNLFSEFATSENPTTNDDFIGLISPDGQKITRLISIAKIISRSPALFESAKTRYLWKERRGLTRVQAAQKNANKARSNRIQTVFYRRISELFHTNTIYVLRDDLQLSNGDVWRKGFFLVCLRNLDSIVVIDPDAERAVWTWGLEELQHPHHPTLLDNGHLLIFDNGSRREASRILELDPGSKEILWHYPQDSETKFFSKDRGSALRLANGNTLITESTRGRAFEITPEGEMVWEYLNRDISVDGTARRTMWRMTRLTEKQIAALNWPDEARTRLIEAGFDL
jgi:hypothetical protein